MNWNNLLRVAFSTQIVVCIINQSINYLKRLNFGYAQDILEPLLFIFKVHDLRVLNVNLQYIDKLFANIGNRVLDCVFHNVGAI